MNTDLWPRVLELVPEQNFSTTCIFPVRHIIAFLCLGTLEDTSALCLGALLNSEAINTKPIIKHDKKKHEKCGTKYIRTLFCSMRTERRVLFPQLGTSPLDNSFFTALRVPANDWKKHCEY